MGTTQQAFLCDSLSHATPYAYTQIVMISIGVYLSHGILSFISGCSYMHLTYIVQSPLPSLLPFLFLFILLPNVINYQFQGRNPRSRIKVPGPQCTATVDSTKKKDNRDAFRCKSSGCLRKAPNFTLYHTLQHKVLPYIAIKGNVPCMLTRSEVVQECTNMCAVEYAFSDCDLIGPSVLFLTGIRVNTRA